MYIWSNVHLESYSPIKGKRGAARMRRGDLPDEIRRFILTSIPSVPYLEAVLLMRSEPETRWDPRRVAGRLYVAERQAVELLEALAASGIAAHDPAQEGGQYRYAPSSAELRERLDTLAHTYSVNLVGVTDLIHSRIDKRAQQFADAFRWRKDSERKDE
jgi:hypothetical protein